MVIPLTMTLLCKVSMSSHNLLSFIALYTSNFSYPVYLFKEIRQCLSNRHRNQMRKSDQQSQPSKPNIVLNKQLDQNYAKVMNKVFEELDGVEYNGTVEEMGDKVLQALKQKYHLVDKDGDPIDDEAALQSMLSLA